MGYRMKYTGEEVESRLDKVEANEESIAAIEGRVTEAEGKITENEEKIAENAGKIAEVEGKAGANEGKIAEVDEATKKNAEGIASLGEQIAEVEKKADANESKIAEVENKADANESKISEVEGKANANATAIEEVGGKADANTESITEIGGKVGGIEESITEINGSIETLLEGVAEIDGKVGANTESIEGLNQMLENMGDVDNVYIPAVTLADIYNAIGEDSTGSLEQDCTAFLEAAREGKIIAFREKQNSNTIGAIVCSQRDKAALGITEMCFFYHYRSLYVTLTVFSDGIGISSAHFNPLAPSEPSTPAVSDVYVTEFTVQDIMEALEGDTLGGLTNSNEAYVEAVRAGKLIYIPDSENGGGCVCLSISVNGKSLFYIDRASYFVYILASSDGTFSLQKAYFNPMSYIDKSKGGFIRGASGQQSGVTVEQTGKYRVLWREGVCTNFQFTVLPDMEMGDALHYKVLFPNGLVDITFNTFSWNVVKVGSNTPNGKPCIVEITAIRPQYAEEKIIVMYEIKSVS